LWGIKSEQFTGIPMGPVDQMTFPKDQKCGKPPYENGTENGTDISGMGYYCP